MLFCVQNTLPVCRGRRFVADRVQMRAMVVREQGKATPFEPSVESSQNKKVPALADTLSVN